MKLVVLATLLGLTTLHGEPVARAELSAAQRELLDFNLLAEGRGMVLSPRVTRKFESVAASPLWPLVRANAESHGGMIADARSFVGVRVSPYRDTAGAVFGCAMCHAGKAAGRFIPGLGNKTIDPYGGAQILLREWERDRRDLRAGHLTDAQRQLTEGALRYAALVTRRDLADQTQGTVSLSWVMNWLYESSGRPLPDKLRIPAPLKVPHLWGYARKREAGLFCDGMGEGEGWLAAVPLTAGLPPKAVRESHAALAKLKQALDELQPPPYPFAIEESAARHGQAIFQENCSGCHGRYARLADGNPDYQSPRWIPIETVQTDRQRLRLTSGNFREVVTQNPLAEIIRTTAHAGKGYFSPRLDGIWSRFPYLHNGSVPNLRSMLTPPPERPTVFSVKRAGDADRFDQSAVGLTMPSRNSIAQSGLRAAARRGSRQVYDTSRPGQSNQGHPFGTHLDDASKIALIEYLKTL